MEPLTAITVLASKYGISKLVGALTGRPDLGGLASEIFGALSASESRLGERLAVIERQLDDVLEQRYTTAVGSGLRTLLDAGTAANAAVRQDELLRARDLFREAVAAARSPLQAALAERYLLLCAIALGRDDAARNALAHLNRAATESMLESSETGANSWVQAERQDERSGLFGGWRKREDRITEQAASISQAAAEAADLAGQLLCESGVLAESLGSAAPPELIRIATAERPGGWQPYQDAVGRWRVRPSGPGPARVGALLVTWHSVRAGKGRSTGTGVRFPRFRATQSGDPFSTFRTRTTPGRIIGTRPSWLGPPRDEESPFRAGRLGRPEPISTVRVDVTVQADPALSRPVTIWLATSRPAERAGFRARLPALMGGHGHKLAAGERKCRVQQTLDVVGVKPEQIGRAHV